MLFLTVGKNVTACGLNEDQVLNSNTAGTYTIEPRLHRYYFPNHQRFLRGSSQPGHFMNLQTYPVSCAMTELVSESVPIKYLTTHTIYFVRWHARSHSFQPAGLRFNHQLVHANKFRIAIPQKIRSGHV